MNTDLTREIRVEMEKLKSRETQLRRELAEVSPTLRRLEKAVALLNNEPLTPTSSPTRVQRYRPNKTRGVSPQLLAKVRETIEQFAVDHEEFRQVDIRSINGMTSSQSTLAFQQLKDEEFIRFSRQDGNSKYYRLTRRALRNQHE